MSLCSSYIPNLGDPYWGFRSLIPSKLWAPWELSSAQAHEEVKVVVEAAPGRMSMGLLQKDINVEANTNIDMDID